MITYRITSKSTSPEPKHSSDKARVLERAAKKATHIYKEGDTVVFKGSKRLATIVGFVLDPEVVHWKGLKPFFIKLKFHDDGMVVATHGASIRKKL